MLEYWDQTTECILGPYAFDGLPFDELGQKRRLIQWVPNNFSAYNGNSNSLKFVNCVNAMR